MAIGVVLLAASIASIAVTETTGKGVGDHAVSAVKGQDCRSARVFKGEDVCQPRGFVTVESASDRPIQEIPPVVPPPKKVVTVHNSVERMEEIFARRKAMQ